MAISGEIEDLKRKSRRKAGMIVYACVFFGLLGSNGASRQLL